MRVRTAGIVLGWACLLPLSLMAEPLTIGDPAPPLTVSKWAKGEKVDKLEPGQVYVVEFWATWCGPCRASIPHLSELQQKFKDITFIGVDVWERDPKAVEPFLKEMGDKMNYRVALDDVPKDAEGSSDGKMAVGWMKAAEIDGIPSAFVVGRDGKIAWIGHPMEIDEPLAKIQAGTWDMKAAASERALAVAENKTLMEAFEKIESLLSDKQKNQKAIVTALDSAIARMPSLARQLGPLKYDVLASGGDPAAASAYGKELVNSILKDNMAALNGLAWSIVDPDSDTDPSRRDIKLALLAAQRASELGEDKDFAVLDTLALATFLSGDAAKAASIQERAVKLSPEKDPGMTDRLEMFRKAANAK